MIFNNDNVLNDLTDFCKYLTTESTKIIQSYYRQKFIVNEKDDNSPVTIADKKTEEKLTELILKEFPEHGILGEEFGVTNKNSDYQWILDPIDGTKSFISGIPLFTTLIGLTKKKKPILGVIHQPITHEFLIGDNNKAFLNDQQVHVRNNKLSNATLLTTDVQDIYKLHSKQNFEKLLSQVKMFRTWGDAYGYFLLATGYADVMIDAEMSIWDIIALVPIIQGAGGCITDYQGNDPIKGNSIVASSKENHSEIIQILNNR